MDKLKIKAAYFRTMYELYRLLVWRLELRETVETNSVHAAGKKRKERLAIEKELKYVQQRSAKHEDKLEALSREAKRKNTAISIEQIAQYHGLDHDEKLVIMILLCNLLKESRCHSRMSGTDLLNFLGYRPDEFLSRAEILTKGANLQKHELVKPRRDDEDSVFATEFELTPKARGVIFDTKLINEMKHDDYEDPGCLLEIREPVVTLDQLVLEEQMEGSIIRTSQTGRFL